MNILATLALLLQLPAVALLLARLVRGPFRQPPLQPERTTPDLLGSVSVVVPTLNEAARIGPCLDGLSHQGYEVREILVVDSRSEDGTPGLVKQQGERDRRFRLITDEPLPPGWVGRPWALHTGFQQMDSGSDWFLGIDADTQPQPGLVPSLVKAAELQELDLLSLSPRFILRSPGEFWLQPALLMTLVYRFGAAGEVASQPERAMANGQCFLCRRSLLVKLDGYRSARGSFCDDVTLARQAALSGARVGFLDGSQVLKVRMYEGMRETWEEWGRSLDLKDASSRSQLYADLYFLTAVQALPFLMTGLFGFGLASSTIYPTPTILTALGLNAALVAIRVALLAAVAGSYDFTQSAQRQGGWLFWLSPLADPLAVLRIALSAGRRPRQWRGRQYGGFDGI
ncbi:glycosyltransferase [Romeria aff. gracilis LEGE 07310]|uniref:Glycosyltransferase n=1 Tax=Vasconcelosia minhoensis LEGE 07310 TaxID=915328 RepID=A0A8J7AAT0_9CYAN|nr:glycosyltransferase family 2 protein [Romeria gracilis]MBE9076064.1 glycosyltransferase [Romeria aff. gracilis LEGE 07310]